jgi:hypothetical protein
MIQIENVEVFGWETAIRGMRNPLNSWSKSDSGFMLMNENDVELGEYPDYEFAIGENDLKLMKNLSKAGNDHAKYLRMINVTCDITSSLYWWKQFDQYKVGVTTNSTSTMHKIHAKEFTLDDFSHEHLSDFNRNVVLDGVIIKQLNKVRECYLETKDKKYWWQMIQLLPSSYNQRRTVQLNYQVLKNMYLSRKHHKLDCWVEFCKWCETLPYFSEICLQKVSD